MPNKVDKIVDAIKRENPNMPEEKVWAIAYAQYRKNGKGQHISTNYTGEGTIEEKFEDLNQIKNSKAQAFFMAVDIATRNVSKELGKLEDFAHKVAPSRSDYSQLTDMYKGINVKLRKAKFQVAKAIYDSQKSTNEGASHNEGSHYALRNDIIEFFRSNQYPDDEEMHGFAESLGVTPEALEKEVYALTSDLLRDFVFTAGVEPTQKITSNKMLDMHRDAYNKSWTDTQTFHVPKSNEAIAVNFGAYGKYALDENNGE